MFYKLENLVKLIKDHNDWRKKSTINLIPSENVLSPEVSALLSSDFSGRYTSREGFYKGTKYIDEIESLGTEIAKEIFDSEYADLRPISGHIADLAFIVSYVKKNETVLCISPEDGGYPGLSKDALPKILGIKVEYMIYNKEDFIVDVNSTIELIDKTKPKCIIFDLSLILRNQPVKEIYDYVKDKGIVIGYDGSHVLGLIGGGEFQNPLKEGAIALFGSTHKTLFGPQGGIILSKEDKISKIIHPSIVDNAHWNRIAALTLSLMELKEFGKDYAKQVIKNAKKLGKTLLEFKMPVKCPKDIITETHQVLLTQNDYKKNEEFANKLEKANIIVDCGIRLGTNEVTRLGMKEKEMEKIAELIYRVYKGEDVEKIKNEVIKIRKEFNEIHFRFKDINIEEILNCNG